MFVTVLHANTLKICFQATVKLQVEPSELQGPGLGSPELRVESRQRLETACIQVHLTLPCVIVRTPSTACVFIYLARSFGCFALPQPRIATARVLA